MPSLNQIDDFIFVFDMSLYTILQEGLAFVLSYLKFLLADVEQVVYCLIVNLNIWAFDIKIYLGDVFTRENCLIV